MTAPRPQLPPEEQHLLDHLDFLRKRWRIVAGVFVGFLVAAAGLSYRLDPVYQATVRILVGDGSRNGAFSERTSAIEGYLLEQRSFETQLEIIRSEPVAERTGRLLGRIDEQTSPQRSEAVIAAIKARTSVERVHDTRIVMLRVSHPDPQTARDMANATAEAYIAYSDEQRSTARHRSIDWLSSETERVREELRISEGRLVDYISEAELDFSAAEEAGIASGSEARRGLRADVAAAEVELAQLRRRYRDLHPKVQDGEARLEGLRRGLVAQQAGRAQDHRKLIQYRILKRDVELDQELYQVLLKKLKEADLEAKAGVANVRVLETAKLPKAPIGPHAFRTLAVAAILGLCLGLGIAYGAEMLDRTASSPDDIQRALGLPTLGVVRQLEVEGRNLVAEAAGSPAGEVFRALRTNLRFSHVDRPRRVVLVTSTGPEEGKSTVLSNLAVSLAQSGRRTLVIDTDMRRPSLHRFFGLSERRGLADLLAGDATLEEVLRQSHIENLDVLASGTRPPNPAELIESQRLQELIAGLRESYDYVLLDSPPAGGLIDSSLMCSLADGVLFVIEWGRFDLKIVRQALRQLERAGAKLYGVVLNKAPVDDRETLYGYYRYGVELESSESNAGAA